MITNFEEITYELTEEEMKYVSGFVSAFNKRVGEENAITSVEITAKFKQLNISMNGARIRKIVNYVRTNKLVKNLIATSKGYYVASSQEQIDKYKLSLQQRINEIQRVLNSFN